MTDRRSMLRMIAPALALPMVAANAAKAKGTDLVSREELKEAFRLINGQRMCAEDLNERLEILIDLIFEADPDRLRTRLAKLHKMRSERDYLVDEHTMTSVDYETFKKWGYDRT